MRQLKFIAVLLLLSMSCVEPYSPELNPDSIKALVVDGHIDASGAATIILSHATPIYEFADAPPEAGATVQIRSSGGETFDLKEEPPGTYTGTDLPFDKSSDYTLYIRTSGGKEYESDVVKVHPTPPVGRVYFTVAPTGDDVEIRTTSRDVSPDATGYYAFECIETYEYTSQFFSRYKRIKESPIPVLRHKGEFVDTCWHELPVPITVTSTTQLSNNFISGHRLTILNKFSKKISRRYSILVRQRAMSEQEFMYRNLLDKTQNQQGSIFAEIPGPVVGNLHGITDPNETVLGYFHGQDVKEQRYFLERFMLPLSLQVPLPPEQCDIEATCPTNTPASGPNTCIDVELLSASKIILDAAEVMNSTVYTFSTIVCGDCTASGGTTKMPFYW